MEAEQGIKLKYKDVGNFEFAQLIQKISQTATNNQAACHIHKIVKGIKAIREQIQNDYQSEIVEKFGKRNEAGVIIRPEGEPKGYEPLEGQEKELSEAHDVFGEKEGTIQWRPLTPSTLADVKISAREIELLGGLFAEENGPGVPDLENVMSMRR